VPSFMEFVLYYEEDPRDNEPLNVHLLVVIEELVVHASDSFDWVVQKVKSFRHFVGLSCEGFEDELMALSTTIEAS
jgi:hypothetical protein